MQLRDYQAEAVQAVFDYWGTAPSTREKPASPLIVMPTGAGKSPTLGELVRRLVQDYGCRVAIVTHRAELIAQDARAVRSVWPQADVGIYSAGLSRREVRTITIAGVQSIARRPEVLGHIDVMIVDEAHLVSPEETTQYGALISALREVNPDMRIVGLTATPYRLGQGYLTEGAGAMFTSVCYEVGVRRLIEAGWLSPVVTGSPSVAIDTSSVGLRLGEFAARDLELASDVDKVNDAVADDVREALAGRTSALIFGTSVDHARRLAMAARWRGLSTETITGETPREERDRIIAAFKSRALQVVTSCDVLTTGFDAPVVDVIALVRPTMSPSLYVQMVGRGMRLAEGKHDCLLLDYGGNIARHGPIDDVKVKAKSEGKGEAPIKSCPKCKAQVAAAARVCAHCGYEWPAPEKKANATASNLPALSWAAPVVKDPPEWWDVGRSEAHVHIKRDSDGPPTLRIDHYSPDDGPLSVPRKIVSEWVCVEHEWGGFAWRKAQAWWAQRCDGPAPETVAEAVEAIEAGAMRPLERLATEKDGKFLRVVEVKHAPMREPGSDDDKYDGSDFDKHYPTGAPEEMLTQTDDGEDEIPW